MIHKLQNRHHINCDTCGIYVNTTSNVQKYCPECKDKAHKTLVDKANKARVEVTWKECKTCNKKVKERGMKLNCKSCINLKKAKPHSTCKRCKNILIPSNKSFCDNCYKERVKERIKKYYKLHKHKRLCRACKGSMDGIPKQYRYCSDKCRDKKVITYEKYQERKLRQQKTIEDLPWEEQTTQMMPKIKEEFEINPFFTQNKGSKRK